MKTAILLERDGILNQARIECRNQGPFRRGWKNSGSTSDAGPLLRKLKKAGFVLIATTNQPGLSLGATFRAANWIACTISCSNRCHWMTFWCVPTPRRDTCPCRKPRSGLFTEAASQVAPGPSERSFRASAINGMRTAAFAARTVGATSLLVQSPWTGSGRTAIWYCLISATIVERILRLQTPRRILAAVRSAEPQLCVNL